MNGANGLLKKHFQLYKWRLDRAMNLIDIDKLLESTSNLTYEKNQLKIKPIEIDQLLEKTRDW